MDATCPHVRKAQSAAKQLADDGYQVVIVGDKNHPEVRSILEWAGEGAVAVNTEEEADALPRYGRLGIVSQTTFSGAKFRKIVSKMLDRSSDIRILRTICTATDQRQAAAVKLAGQVDVMIVVGAEIVPTPQSWPSFVKRSVKHTISKRLMRFVTSGLLQ